MIPNGIFNIISEYIDFIDYLYLIDFKIINDNIDKYLIDLLMKLCYVLI